MPFSNVYAAYIIISGRNLPDPVSPENALLRGPSGVVALVPEEKRAINAVQLRTWDPILFLATIQIGCPDS